MLALYGETNLSLQGTDQLLRRQEPEHARDPVTCQPHDVHCI